MPGWHYLLGRDGYWEIPGCDYAQNADGFLDAAPAFWYDLSHLFCKQGREFFFSLFKDAGGFEEHHGAVYGASDATWNVASFSRVAGLIFSKVSLVDESVH